MSQSGASKPPLSAKAVLHQRYGDKAQYKVEEVSEPGENDCPGLSILHQNRARVSYQCHLQLPELCVTSEKFSKKKDAEQSAARMALDKLGIQAASKDLTPEEAWDELVARISSLFTDKFCFSSHPIVSHIRDAVKREKDARGLIPISIVAACDSKIVSLIRLIDPKAESNPLLVSSLVLEAARLTDSVRLSSRGFWIGKKDSYSCKALQSLTDISLSKEHLSVRALFIPASSEKPIESLTLKLPPGGCYMDEISRRLGIEDSSYVLLSRPISRASSERRFYFSETSFGVDEIINLRASCFSGQKICGDAILATFGYTWRSRDLFYEDVTLSTYYRMLLGMTPDGCYKISRDALLAVKLPSSFTLKSNWRGLPPKDLLCMFCRNHRLMEPLFAIKELPLFETQPRTVKGPDQMDNGSDGLAGFACEVKILSKQQDIILECLGESCKKQGEAIQKAALSVLSWLDRQFNRRCTASLCQSSDRIQIDKERFGSEFAQCFAILELDEDEEEDDTVSFRAEEPVAAAEAAAAGSMVSISYSVSLVTEGSCRHVVESKDELEFEMGTGSAVDPVESCVSLMCAGQSAQFVRSCPPCRKLVLAAAASRQSAELVSLSDLRNCNLEYSLKLLQITEPNEDRMEKALFSPSLSKQRVDFALGLVNASLATSLVDFGCGSGSLLDSLMEHQTTLEKVVGVDISERSLCRAAKMLHAKLTKENSIKSVVLYGGSITEYDSRLRGFDVGTCLEVIEHMEEEEAAQFGDVALSLFCPGLLIVSTPNYEYNPLLQGMTAAAAAAAPAPAEEEEKSTGGPHRFRNHDHKFEWTRAQFERWAVALATRHSYDVDFGGVGGSGDIDPGFASQVAVFRRRSPCPVAADAAAQPYGVIWEWPSSSSTAQ